MIRPIHAALAAALLAMAAPQPVSADTDIANMSPAERAAFGAEVRAFLLENPEVIYEAIQILEERRNQAAGTLSGGQQQMRAQPTVTSWPNIGRSCWMTASAMSAAIPMAT